MPVTIEVEGARLDRISFRHSLVRYKLIMSVLNFHLPTCYQLSSGYTPINSTTHFLIPTHNSFLDKLHFLLVHRLFLSSVQFHCWWILLLLVDSSYYLSQVSFSRSAKFKVPNLHYLPWNVFVLSNGETRVDVTHFRTQATPRNGQHFSS